MNRTLTFIIVILLIGCSNTKKKNLDTDWNILSIKDKNCEVSFPYNTYKMHKEEYYVEDVGKVFSYEIDLNTQKLNDKNLGYKLTIYDYPEFNFYKTPETINNFLHGTAENLLLGLNASRLWEQNIEFNGFHGKELYLYMASQEVYFTIRMYIINGRQYSLTVITDKNNLINKSITKYFDSFKLINNKP
jgi:hypothetical protein